MEVEQIKQMLKELSDDDLKALKEYINAEDAELDSKTKEVNQEVDNDEKAETDSQSETDETNDEITEMDEKQAEKADDEQTDEEREKATLNPLNEPLEEQEYVPQEETIPTMQKGESENEDKVEEQTNLEPDNGRDIPVDFEQIIEAQNAKITALEIENASLKSKVDAAFGYSAKVSMPTKTNKLYDECSDVHFHR